MLPSSTISSAKAFSLLVWTAVVFWIFLLFIQQTYFSASDLGRHIMNGSVIIQSGTVFQNNLYSYTNPDFAAPNHHWLFGVLVYGLHKLGGFPLITVTIALTYWLGIMSVVALSKRAIGNWPTFISAVLLLPLFAMRTETRPEAFSVLGLSITIIICHWLWQRHEKSERILATAALFFTMLLWVNLHILFVLGFMATGVYFLFSFVYESKQHSLRYLSIIAAQLAAALLNPLGWKTLAYPFTILRDYQYPIAENQSVLFFLRYHPSPKFIFLTILLVALSYVIAVSFKKVSRQKKPIWLISAILIIATALMNRFSGFLQVSALLVAATAISQLRHSSIGKRFFTEKWVQQTYKKVLVGVAAIALLTLLFSTQLINPFGPLFGLGITVGSEDAGLFFKENNLPGPIFNNYDIGGSLIYSLYPTQPVFVDNRPEAYPGSFFTNEYIDAQENEEVWAKLEQKYQFNTIFFFRHDATDWAMPFIIKRMKDSSWAPVYVDDYSLILLKRTDSNQQLIEKLELPPSYYSIQKN